MIYKHPTDAILGAADIVGLFDPQVPGWHEVVSKRNRTDGSWNDFVVVDIPVDSTDAATIEVWRERIGEARLP